MKPFKNDQISGEALDHLGLVATMIKKVRLQDRIDKRLPVAKEKGACVTMGERVTAMILNAIGFIDTRLYMFSEFLSDKPIHRLMGPHLKAEDFTDDCLGRCLDAIHEYGPTQLFSDVVFGIVRQLNLLGKTVHIDTTSLSLYGEYDNEEDPTKTIDITYGYSKDGFPNLKQVILSLATSGKANLPLFMAGHSGNASDQKLLIQAAKQIEEVCKKVVETPSFTYVADSAMYESCLQKHNLFWLSRVPMLRKEVKKFIENHKAYEFKSTQDPTYKIYSQEKIVKEIKQRWLLVFSQKAHDREVKFWDERKEKIEESFKKKLWHLSNQVYACEADAQKALRKFEKELKYHQVSDVSFVPLKGYEGKGRPKKEDKKVDIGFKIEGTLSEDPSKIEAMLAQKGLFVLATNQLDKSKLSDEEMLLEYKEQQQVERGFAFIKSHTFEVSSVFLKKPSRIQALMMIMVLTLFIYSLTQYMVRKTLKERNESVPNQLKKPIQTPTSVWIFYLFRNIQLLKIRGPDLEQELIINLTPLLERIIGYFGEEAMSIYGLAQTPTS